MNATDTIWSSVLSTLAATLRPEQFETWFRDVVLLSADEREAVIQVPNAFYCKWFELHYTDLIRQALASATGTKPALRIEIAPHELRPRPSHENPSTPVQSPSRGAAHDARLNSNYTFGSFVIGPDNQLAHAAALAVAEAPGHSYNPLFLHAGVGLGKTHLMQAVAHALLKRRPGFIVRYLPGESFMNQFIYALQKGGIEQFRARCRRVDALLIDDIHTLISRQRTQEEFFHTFNELYNAHKQIILSSDSVPEDLATFEDRLISRFKWGLVVRIDPPCVETRMAIIRKKAELRGKDLPDDVVAYIAEAVPRNIRELEGAVLKTIGYAALMNRPADIVLAREILRTGSSRPQHGAVSCDHIQDVVARWFGLKPQDLAAKTRARSVAFPRQVAMYLTRQLTNKSLEEVGSLFGGRDHSTVAHACDRIARGSAADPELKSSLENLTRQIRTD